jgi:acyl-CoA thioesterase-2
MSHHKRLLDILTLQQTGENVFTGESLDIGSPQVYGGQVLAQSLQAADATTDDDRILHSMHGYFLSPGDMSIPIIYQVEKFKDGRSFNTRRVKAMQNGREIFLMACSYHIAEVGYSHQVPMPNVAQPESLSSFPEIFREVAEKLQFKPKGIYSADGPILFHPVEHYNPLNPTVRAPITHAWFRLNGDLPIDQRFRKSILAYASDFNLLITSLFPHAVSLFTKPMRIASLDHSMWFHRPIVDDDWMLYVVESPNAFGAKGFCTGRIYSRKGDLLCSVTQEGLIRNL